MMTYPATTAFFSALFALLYVGMAGWVIAGRLTFQALFGDGGRPGMERRIRIHANFAEYVPFALLLIALYEAGGGSIGLVRTLLVILLIARILHPIGMFAPVNSLRQYACRGGGIVATIAVMVVAALALLI